MLLAMNEIPVLPLISADDLQSHSVVPKERFRACSEKQVICQRLVQLMSHYVSYTILCPLMFGKVPGHLSSEVYQSCPACAEAARRLEKHFEGSCSQDERSQRQSDRILVWADYFTVFWPLRPCHPLHAALLSYSNWPQVLN